MAVLLALAAPVLAAGMSAVAAPARPVVVVAAAPVVSAPATTTPPPPPPPTTASADITSARTAVASCASYGAVEQAQDALAADQALAAVLDSDGDGQACERRWPRTPPRPEAPPPAAEPPPRAPPAGPSCPDSGFGGVRPHVAVVGHHLAARFGVDRILGVGSRALATSDHPRGLAIDLFVDRATGDDLAAYVLEHRGEWGVRYVIWRQRINLGGGWDLMADRGGITANHQDHVHISFAAGADPQALTC